MTGVARQVLVLLLATAAALIATGPAGAFSRQEVRIASTDGTALAATLTLPDAAPPTGGWPAVIFMHGLGQNRATGLAVAQAMGIGERYAVLAFDARGHGESGGLIGIDGPREVADVRAVFSWLRDRPDVMHYPNIVVPGKGPAPATDVRTMLADSVALSHSESAGQCRPICLARVPSRVLAKQEIPCVSA